MNLHTVEADPKRPYKAVAATVLAFIGLVWANLQGVEDWGTLDFQDWVTIVVPALLVFGGTYFTRNPKVTDTHRFRGDGGETVLGFLGIILVVLGVILLALTLLKVIAVTITTAVALLVIGVIIYLVDRFFVSGRRRY